jgi:hypothetical protein
VGCAGGACVVAAGRFCNRCYRACSLMLLGEWRLVLRFLGVKCVLWLTPLA